MAFLKLLLNIGLIFLVATVLLVNGESENGSITAIEYRLPDKVVPMHYDIKLKLHIREDDSPYDGESSADIEIRNATRDISLHALNLTIDEAVTSLVNSDEVIYTPIAHIYDNQTQILVLHFNNELPPGIYVLNIKFIGLISNDMKGIFKQSYINERGEKKWLAVTHFEPIGARRAFPCWDEPALKATFNISIKHHRNYTALSNMLEREQSYDSNEDGMMWTYFEKTPQMCTYLVAFVVADYVRVASTSGKINVWCRSQLTSHVEYARNIAEISGKLLTWYTNLTEMVPKMDHVVVPQYPFIAMENWGLIIYM